VADALALPHHDTDDYFWQPTVPPYQKKRERADRLRLMQEVFLPRADWVLSGSQPTPELVAEVRAALDARAGSRTGNPA
jgi:hypothetical protein